MVLGLEGIKLCASIDPIQSQEEEKKREEEINTDANGNRDFEQFMKLYKLKFEENINILSSSVTSYLQELIKGPKIQSVKQADHCKDGYIFA